MFWQIKSLLTPEKPVLFPFVDGLRAVSILWIIAFHTLWFFGFYLSPVEFTELSRKWFFFPILQGHLAVDCFFVISGFLIAYYLFVEYKQSQSINIKRFYWRRLWRLLPAYFVVMLIVGIFHPQNIDNSWANLLYINNFLSIQQQFMPWTWSLAIEEQFYILFPFVMGFIFRRSSPLIILISLFVLSGLIRYFLVIYYQFQLPLPVHEVINKAVHYDYFDKIYDKTYSRFGGLVIGVLLAYGVVFKNWVAILNRQLLLRRCLLVLSLSLLLIYLRVPPVVKTVSVNETAIFLALVRHVFSLAVAYLILYSLTTQGRNHFVIRFFSNQFWYPIAQLSYSAYLIHLLVVAGIAMNHYQGLQPNFILLSLLITITCLLSLFLAAIIFLTVEKPILRWRNTHFPRG